MYLYSIQHTHIYNIDTHIYASYSVYIMASCGGGLHKTGVFLPAVQHMLSLVLHVFVLLLSPVLHSAARLKTPLQELLLQRRAGMAPCSSAAAAALAVLWLQQAWPDLPQIAIGCSVSVTV